MHIQGSFTQRYGPAIVAQVLALFFGSIILDNGESQLVLFITAIGFWLGIGLILLRRREMPTRNDVRFIRIGYIQLAAATFLSVLLVGGAFR